MFTQRKDIQLYEQNKCFSAYNERILTVNPEFSLRGCNATAVFSCAAVDTHVSGQHSGNDKLVAAFLIFINHVMVILLQ